MDPEGERLTRLVTCSAAIFAAGGGGGGSSDGDTPRTTPRTTTSSSSVVNQMLQLICSDDSGSKIHAAMEIRRLTKTSQRYRRHFSGAVGPLVDMLRSGSVESNEAALLALLNLAVKDEA